MKTPEEIKKGLLHCEREKCKGCPYYDKCMMADAHTDLHTDALAYIQQLEMQHGKDINVPRWISVDDDLPAHVITPCLIYADEHIEIADWSHDKYGLAWWFFVDGEYATGVTHWMPMPEPPKVE